MEMDQVLVKIEEPDLLENGVIAGASELSSELGVKMEIDQIEVKIDPNDLPFELEDASAFGETSNNETKIFKRPKKEIEEAPDFQIGIDSESNCELEEKDEETYAPPPDPVLLRTRYFYTSKKKKKTPTTEVPKPVKCSKCHLEFPTAYYLQQHRKVHKDDPKAKKYKYLCSICKKGFMEKDRLNLHKLYIHYINVEEEAEETTSNLPLLNNHQPAIKLLQKVPITVNVKPIILTEDKFKCCKCSMTFKTAFRLQNHEHSAHPVKKEFQCSKCQLKFSSESTQQLHEKFTHPVSPDPSPTKDEETVIQTESPPSNPDANNLSDSSESIIHNPIPLGYYPCPLCPESFRSKQSLTDHRYQVHLKTKSRVHRANFKCFKCDQTFTSFLMVCRHEKHHGNKYPCQLCPGVFKYRKDVLLHRSVAHPGCEEYEYKAAINRKRPIGGNTKWTESRYNCLDCPEIFATSEEAIEHEKSHGDKFPCDFCPAVFKTAHGLRTHRGNVHPERDQYKCSKCGMAFGMKCRRDRHMRMHRSLETKTRFKVKCWKCKLKFLTLTEKTRHDEEFHPSLPSLVYCHLCHKVFKLKKYLIKHQSQKHPKKKQVAKPKQQLDSCETSESRDFLKLSTDSTTSEQIEKSVGLLNPEEVFVKPDIEASTWDQSELEDTILGF